MTEPLRSLPQPATLGPTTDPLLEGLSREDVASARQPSGIVRALAHPDYRNFWLGNFLSNIGTWMQNIAQGWLVLQLTDSAFWLGMIGFASAFPVTVFTLFGGVIADRVDKKRLIFITQSVMMVLAFLLAALTYWKKITVAEVILIAFFTGVANALNSPSYQALVPRLVPREDLSNAIALNSAQFNLSRVLGPALGGFAMRLIGIAGNFFVNAFSFVAVLIALARIKYRDDVVAPAQRNRVTDDLRAGFVYVFRNPSASGARMAPMVTLVTVTSLLVFPYISFMPLFARDVLHSGEQGLGILMACSGIGAFLSAALIAKQTQVRCRGLVIMRAGICYCVSIILFSLSTDFWLSAAMQFAAGFAMLFMVANVNTALQEISSDEMRGRVMSIYATAFLGLVPLGSLIAGALGHVFHAPYVIAAMSTLGLAYFLYVYCTSKAMRARDESDAAV